jgi:hypothetical protein
MQTSPRIGLTMKNAKGIKRERRLFFQAGTECDFTLNSAADPYAWRVITLNDEIERRQRGKIHALLKPISRPAWPKNMQSRSGCA